MDLGLKGLKVIVTGGSRGIGRAALEIFAAEGADVGFFSRNQAQVDETIASLSKHGGKVIGVIPHYLRKKEVAYEDADELIVTKDLRERKAIMEERADAFVALPGGFGTLEEILEILTLKQLEAHGKPVVFLNTNGFFAPLLAMFSLMGLNPVAVFPIMAGAGALMMPASSVRFLKSDRIDLKLVLSLALGGIPAVLLAAYVVKSLPLETLRWVVTAVVLYTAVVMLRSATKRA